MVISVLGLLFHNTSHSFQTHSCQGLVPQLKGTQFNNQHIHTHPDFKVQYSSLWLCLGLDFEEVCPGKLFFHDLLISKLDGQEKPPMALLSHLLTPLAWWLMGTGGNLCSQRGEGEPIKWPFDCPCRSPSSVGFQLSHSKSAALWWPKSPGQREMSPSQGHSPILGQPWLCCGFAAWPGKDSQIQATTSFFFISP